MGIFQSRVCVFKLEAKNLPQAFGVNKLTHKILLIIIFCTLLSGSIHVKVKSLFKQNPRLRQRTLYEKK